MASSLEGVLANIPGLGGYLAAQQQDQRGQLGQLQQMGVLQGILAQQQRQQQSQQALMRDQQLKGVLSQLPPDATPDQVVQAIRPFASADDILRITQGSADRKAQRDQTAELAKQRISESVRRGDQMFELRRKSETRADRRQLIDEEWKKYRAAAEQELAKYNTGGGSASFVLPPMPPQEAEPGTLQTTAPNMAAAMQQFAQGGGAPRTVTIDDPQAQQPALAPAPFGAAPQPAQAPAPAAPNNLDARDYLAQRTAPQGNLAQLLNLGPTGQASPAARPQTAPATAAPQMPNFVGPPREVNRMRNEWMADQAKAAAKNGGKLGLDIAGGRESVFINRVVNSGNQAAADLENVTKLPITVSRGFFGGREQGKGLLDAGKETLANTMTTQEVQMYNVFATGFQRALAAIEGAGLAPSNALMNQMDSVIFKEGDTHFTKLAKLAQTRQIVEKGLETISANSRVDPETKKLVADILGKVRKSVPFTGADIISLSQLQGENPNATLNDILKGSGATPGGWNDDKERRYQELLRKRGG